MNGGRVNRRDFLGGASAVCGVAFSVSLPWLSEPVGAAEPTRAWLSDWHIDDAWGAYPRYAEPIGYASPRERAETAAVGSIDALLYV